VEKLLFLGSSCIYPKNAQQPLKEEYLLTAPLETTNEAYAIAKIAGVKQCQFYHQQYGCKFISAMPTNLYGQGDNYDLSDSHVLPALIRKFHEAKLSEAPHVVIWGTGLPMREFMYVDDAANACYFLMQEYESPEIINIGTGKDTTISSLALLIKEITGYPGELIFDHTKPDGTPRKLLNIDKILALGWFPQFTLREGIKKTYADFVLQYDRYTKKRNLHLPI
jgi:GDP-L-fucose synthase